MVRADQRSAWPSRVGDIEWSQGNRRLTPSAPGTPIRAMVLDQTGAVVPQVAVVLTDEAGVPQATTRRDAAGTASRALLLTFWVALATAVPGHVETFA
jgi:hypothetical protein